MRIRGVPHFDFSLFPEEAEAVAAAVLSRRREFATGRACARAALAALDIGAMAIRVGAHREPLFPPGVVGSITHTSDICASAVCRAGLVIGLGIDAELNRPLPEGVESMLLTCAEEREVARLHSPRKAVDSLLFSAKESLFKAMFPFLRRYAEFTEAEFAIDMAAGRCYLCADSPLARSLPRGAEVNVAFRFSADHVFTAATISRLGREVEP